MTDTNLVHELQIVADYLRYKYRYTDVVKNISLSSTGGAFIYLRTYTVKSPVQLYSTREAAEAAREE